MTRSRAGALSHSRLLPFDLRYIATLACLAALLTGCTSDAPPTPIEATATPLPFATARLTAVSAADPATSTPAISAPSAMPSPALPLLGRRIGLDPGHGPRSDMGAVLVDPDSGKLVLSEAELNLDVALRARDLLVERGATVTLTRQDADSFTAPWPPDTNGDGTEHDHFDDLQERVDILNAAHAEVFLSIHSNSSASTDGRKGIQAYYCDTSDCAFTAQSKRLGTAVLDHLASKLSDIGIKADRIQLRSDFWSDAPGQPPTHLFLTGTANPPHHPRATQMPGIVIEAFYVTSPTEAALLKRDNVRQAIALAYADALQDYLLSQR